MKKLTYLLFLAIGVVGCSVESMDSDELLTADARFRSQSTVTITPPAGELCAGEVLTFSVNVTTSAQFQVQQWIEGQWIQVHQEAQGQTGSKDFDVVLAVGANSFRYTNQTGGGWTVYPSTFTGIDCNTCENSLEVDLVCGDTNTATFTFTAVEAGAIVIQGGLTNGTTIVNATSNVLSRNTTHNSVENSNSNVTRWEGDVDACEVVTITISFTGGNGIGDWSAKRGDGDDEVTLGETASQGCN